MKTVAIIQARMGSSRLPGKVLMPLGESTAIEWVINRVRQCTAVDEIIVATTVEEQDTILADFMRKIGISCFRGSEKDVLDRYYFACRSVDMQSMDIVVRITADCQFLDPLVCDNIIQTLKRSDADYVSNTIKHTFPDGLDCEAMRFSALAKAWREASFNYEREHVTQYIIRHPAIFKIQNYECEKDLSMLRWTLDELEDYEFLSAVVNGIGKQNFNTEDILLYLDTHPEVKKINSFLIRNESLYRDMHEEGLL